MILRAAREGVHNELMSVSLHVLVVTQDEHGAHRFALATLRSKGAHQLQEARHDVGLHVSGHLVLADTNGQIELALNVSEPDGVEVPGSREAEDVDHDVLPGECTLR